MGASLERTGFCKCGCGTPTSNATRTDKRLGQRKGEPLLYATGHARYIGWHNISAATIEQDTGYETPCHLWTKKTSRKGYAYWFPAADRDQLVHRAVWEREHGPIPDGWTVHHKCRVRHCVRGDHLEALPTYEHEQEQLAARLRSVQAQDSLTDQMLRVASLADEAGEYDAADWIRRHFGGSA